MIRIRAPKVVGSCSVWHADCRDVVPTFAPNTFDAVVTDPPYVLQSIVKRFGDPNAAPAKSNGATGVYRRVAAGFMGKQWDNGQVVMSAEFWFEVMRTLKPGAHVVAFSHPRTYHRMACAIEDAGFEIRDSLMWMFAKGFPKSHNLDGTFEGWGTALKPAFEPIVLVRKPLSEKTVPANMAKWGVGAINVDACRIAGEERPAVTGFKNGAFLKRKAQANDRPWMHAADPDESAATQPHSGGRWPANVVHDGSDEVVEMFPRSTSSPYNGRKRNGGTWDGGMFSAGVNSSTNYVEEGSAARFFYSSKADRTDRAGSDHPTIKPIGLMAWLVRLVTPVGGLVLDPFAGTGTVGVAAQAQGMRAALVEMEAASVTDIVRRLAMRLPDRKVAKGVKSEGLFEAPG